VYRIFSYKTASHHHDYYFRFYFWALPYRMFFFFFCLWCVQPLQAFIFNPMAAGIVQQPPMTAGLHMSENEPFTFVAKASFITSDFNDLIYSAPASLQLLPLLDPTWGLRQNTSSILDTKIIASPYNDANHLLDLNSLGVEDRILSLALTTIRPVKQDYATLELVDGLNIAEVNEMIQRLCSSLNLIWTSRSYYLVIFRSHMKQEYNQTRLFELDKHSHEEAIQSGGLLKYWFGTVNEHRRNLAFCMYLALLKTEMSNF
jgi:hypothetical protein